MTNNPFSLARRLRAGETVYSAWCGLASTEVAATIAREGFAAVVIDAQHGLWDTASTVAAVAAVHHAGATPLVRVPLNDFAFVSRALDFGAEAIIAPMINTPTDARAFAAVAKYPPLGERSWGPMHAMALQGRSVTTDYLREANEGTLTLAMIETPTALANVDDIAATVGIDALFIGPYDLSTSLSGGTAQDVQAPEVERAIDRICAAAKNAGKIPGIYCGDAERARAMTKRGFRFITVGNDLGVLREGTAAQLKALKAFSPSCMDGPLSARAFWRFGRRIGSGHVYGLWMRSLTAGPDGDRGSSSNHSDALLRAMTARSVSIPVPDRLPSSQVALSD